MYVFTNRPFRSGERRRIAEHSRFSIANPGRGVSAVIASQRLRGELTASLTAVLRYEFQHRSSFSGRSAASIPLSAVVLACRYRRHAANVVHKRLCALPSFKRSATVVTAWHGRGRLSSHQGCCLPSGVFASSRRFDTRCASQLCFKVLNSRATPFVFIVSFYTRLYRYNT